MNQSKETGFTLVELIAVMVITGIIASIAAPRFIGADAFNAHGSYNTIISALRFAQKVAIAQRTLVYTNINPTSHVVCLGYTINCSTPVIDPSTQLAYSKTLSNDVAITTSTNSIGFDGLGRPLPNVAAILTIQNAVMAGESNRTINVEAETGYVH